MLKMLFRVGKEQKMELEQDKSVENEQQEKEIVLMMVQSLQVNLTLIMKLMPKLYNSM